ncbi:MAG: peptide chain release factor-like protein [Verrucomicrobiales bacterium]
MEISGQRGIVGDSTPFDALRQVAFCRSPPASRVDRQSEMDSLEQRMDQLKIREEDLEERFVLGSGSGGQKINKTASCVYLKHLPSGLEISCQESRSRERNREIARARLCEHFEALAAEQKQRRARERARKRYQKRRPSKAAKARKQKQKQMRSEKKKYRRKPTD